MRLYLAGPLFTQAEQRYNRELAALLQAGGHDVLLPQDDCAVCFPPHVPADAPIDWTRVYDICIKNIDRAEALVAVLDGSDPDSGTCYEVGYAVAKGKPVLGLRTDLRPGEVTEHGVNAMLGIGCARVVKTAGEDIEATAKLVLDALQAFMS